MNEVIIYGENNSKLIELLAIDSLKIACNNYILIEVVGKSNRYKDRLLFAGDNYLKKLVLNSELHKELYQVLATTKADLKTYLMTILYAQIERYGIKKLFFDFPINY